MPSSTLFTRTIGNEWHHLFFYDERMIRVGFGKEQLRVRGHIHARGFGQARTHLCQ